MNMNTNQIDLNVSIKENNNVIKAFDEVMKRADLSKNVDVYVKDNQAYPLDLEVLYYPTLEEIRSEKYKDNDAMLVYDISNILEKHNANYMLHLVSCEYKPTCIPGSIYYKLNFNIYRNSMIDNSISNSGSFSYHKIGEFWDSIKDSYKRGTLCRIETDKYGRLLANENGPIMFEGHINYPYQERYTLQIDEIIKKIKLRFKKSNKEYISYNKLIFEYRKHFNRSTEFIIYIR